MYDNFIHMYMYFVIFTINVFLSLLLLLWPCHSCFWGENAIRSKSFEIYLSCSLRTADAFPVVASLPRSYFSKGEKRRLEMRLLFAGYVSCRLKIVYFFVIVRKRTQWRNGYRCQQTIIEWNKWAFGQQTSWESWWNIWQAQRFFSWFTTRQQSRSH